MKSSRRERGATLVIALIMLVLLTLFAVSGLNTGTTNLKIVGNMQSRGEAMNTAQEAIETAISTPQFIATPENAVLNPCGTANMLCADLNADGVVDYVTRLNPAPACVTTQPIKMSEIKPDDPEDKDCMTEQSSSGFGIAGVNTGSSLCAHSVWEITAETTSAQSGARAAVTQGVGVRISTDKMATSCL
jgi:hypothetical protein